VQRTPYHADIHLAQALLAVFGFELLQVIAELGHQLVQALVQRLRSREKNPKRGSDA
jgi:hypothetical protein